MKKSITYILVFCMVLSLCVPALANAEEETESLITTVAPIEADEVVFTDTFENITDNLLYPSSTSPNKGGINSFDMLSAGNKLTNQITTGATARVGVMKSTDATNTIQFTNIFDDTGSRNVAPYYTLQYWYDQGYDTLVLGTKIPSNTDGNGNYTGTGTYTNDNATTGNKITGKPFDGAYLKAVDSPTGENDKVLEYNFGTVSNALNCYTSMKSLQMRIEMGNNAAYVADKNGVADGRKLAYSWDIYVPKGSLSSIDYSRNTLGYGGIKNSNGILLEDRTYYTSGKLKYAVYGYDLADTARATKITYEIPMEPDTWNTIKEVVTYDGDEYPVVTVYLNGEKVVECQSSGAMAKSNSKGYYPGIIDFRFTSHQSTKDTKFNVYVDNVMQYFVKNLAVSGLDDDFDGISSKDDITLEYTTPMNFEALENAISLTKDGGETDATATVEKIDDYKAKITFSGLDFSKATDYELTIAEFADIYGQKAEGKTVSITTKVAGKIAVSVSDTSIDYEPGTHKTFAITTDVKTDLSNIKFYLKNSDGETVKELTPALNDEGTVLTFDLYDASLADTASSYTFVSEGYFAEDGGDSTNSDIISIPVNVVSYNYGGTYIINDNLESDSIVKDTNWLTNSDVIPSGWQVKWMHENYNRGEGKGEYTLNEDGTTYSFKNCAPISGTECSTTFSDAYLTDSYVAVTEDPKNSGNNVIKYQAGKNGDGLHGFRVYNIKSTSGTNVDVTKNIVMSADVLLTESLKNNMRDYSFNDLPVLSTRNNIEDQFLSAQFKSTADGLVLTGRDGLTTNLKTDEWFEIKYIVMPTEKRTEIKDENDKVTAVEYDQWTYMAYINDVLVEVNEKYVFTGSNGSYTVNDVKYTGAFATNSNTGLKMYGIHFGLYPKNNGDSQPTFYVDNVKLYQPDKLTSVTSFSQNVVTFTFNNVLAKDITDKVYIASDGDAVENAIENITLTDGGKVLCITLNEDVIEPATQYTLKGISDVFGQISGGIDFVSPKSYSVYVDSVGDVDTTVSGKVKVPVKVENVSGKNVEAAIMVAVYDKGYKMVGISVMEFAEMDGNGYDNIVEVDVKDCPAENIDCIKVHLWKNVAGMQAYHTAETVKIQ